MGGSWAPSKRKSPDARLPGSRSTRRSGFGELREPREAKRVGGGYDRNINDLRTREWMIDYIHANPVRRDLIQRVVEWEWSSARWYAGMRPVRLEMDRTLPIFED